MRSVTLRDHGRGAFERALAFCQQRHVFERGDRVLVGSGSGAASLGVLGFLRLAQGELGLADVAAGAVDPGGEDHAEATADVGRLARQLGVTFYAVSAEGRSPTRALLALAKREGFVRVALGHTRDDAVARVLARMLEGRGPERVRGFVARRRDGVVRPLLGLREAEALELARAAGIEPPALMPPDEPRGRAPLEARLRTVVLPRLRVEVPGVDATLLTLARKVRGLTRLADATAAERVARARREGGSLELEVCPSPALAEAVARASLRAVGLAAALRPGAEDSLARLLRPRRGSESPREVVLGSGLVATYLPERRVVALRVLRLRRPSDEVIG